MACLEPRILCFKIDQSLLQGSRPLRNFRLGEARRNVLRAVPVVGFNRNNHGAKFSHFYLPRITRNFSQAAFNVLAWP